MVLALLPLVQSAIAAKPISHVADAEHILNMENHEIEEVPLPGTSRLSGRNSQTIWINVLHLPDVNARIPLARTSVSHFATRDGREYVERYGFDPSTFKLRWLDPGKLLLVSWRTFPRGSGIFKFDGNVVLQVYRGSVCEIFRDSFCSASRGGWGCGSYSRLAIAYEPDGSELVLRKQIRTVTGGETPIPMGRKGRTDGGVTVYFRTVTTLKTWRYRVVPFSLRFESSHEELLLGDSHDVAAVADVAGVTVENLRRHNPRLRESDTCTGTVVLRPYIDAYRASRYDALAQMK